MHLKQILFLIIILWYVTTQAQTTFEENGIVYLEDVSQPEKMQVFVVQKQSPLLYPGQSAYAGDLKIPVVIEHDLDTYNVVGIGPLAFMNCSITSLDIEAPIISITDNTIYSTTLKKLKLPDTLREMKGVYVPNIEEIYFGSTPLDISESPFLFYLEGNQKRDYHIPWTTVPAKPIIRLDNDNGNPVLNLFVTKGMKEEYVKKWDLMEVSGVNVIEE